MELGKMLKESCWFAIGTALSCGPSQVVGLVKGSFDLAYLALTQAKIARLQHRLTHETGIDLFKTKTALETNKSLQKERIKSLKGDGLLLIPLLGANLAWRVYKKNPTYHASPLVEFSTTQLLAHSDTYIRMLFYPFSTDIGRARATAQGFQIPQMPSNSPAKVVKIDVLDGSQKSGKRSLDARYFRHEEALARPTVVIFHPNATTCDGVVDYALYYFKRGYDVLTPTMGGYPGSSPCATSEVTSLQDVEAVRNYLQEQGVTSVGYHGISIGGSLAFQAATCSTKANNLKTMFVIADQTFTKPADVAANCVPSALKSVARGAARAAFPKERKVWLNENVVAETDGLNNKKKAQRLRKLDIPLFVIKASHDDMMQTELGANHRNQADDLLKARYPHRKDRKGHALQLFGPHCTFFASHWSDSLQIFLKDTLPKEPEKKLDEGVRLDNLSNDEGAQMPPRVS